MVRVSVCASVQKDKRTDTDVQIRTKHRTHTHIHGWVSIYNRHTTEAFNSNFNYNCYILLYMLEKVCLLCLHQALGSVAIDTQSHSWNMSMASKWESFIFTCNSQLELPLPIPCNSVESDTGCTSRIYFDIVTLSLYNVTPTSQKPCKYNNKLDCSEKNTQDALNEA